MSFAPVSMKVADSIAAYRIVKVSAANTVALTDTTTSVPFGITQDNSNAANQYVPVAVAGIARVYCNDSIAAGGAFMTDATGRAVPYVAASTGNYMVGVNVGPKVNATGAIAEVLIRPLFTAVPA